MKDIFDQFRLTKAYQIYPLEAIVWQGTREEFNNILDESGHGSCWRLDAFYKEGFGPEDMPSEFKNHACGPTAKSLIFDNKLAKYLDNIDGLDYLRRNTNGTWSVGFDGVLYQGKTPEEAIQRLKDANMGA